MKAWRADRIWPDSTVAILAGGASMSKEVADSLNGNSRVIAVNNSFMLAPWADILYAADAKWWQLYSKMSTIDENDPFKFRGMKVSIIVGGLDMLPERSDILCLKSTGDSGLELDRGGLRTCGNSGYQAMNLAVHLGASKIILCGFDMNTSNSDRHWHGSHIAGVRTESHPLKMWISSISNSAKDFELAGVEVVNCTPGTGLKCFKTESLEKTIESLRDDKRNAAISA